MWGTTRPTKLMIPANATADEVSIAMTTISAWRIRSTSTPRWRAGLSPRESKSRRRAKNGAAMIPATASGSAAATLDQVAAAKLPICQLVIDRSSASSEK